MKKLAIITTHPIQYYAPLFRELSKNDLTEVKVFYTWGESSLIKHDPGFNKTIEWDIPLLDGYNYEFLLNTASSKGTHHFNGIINPDAIKSINNFKPDIILIYGWSWNSHLKIIRYYKGKIPVWFRGDSTLLNSYKGLKGSIKSLIKKLFLTWVYNHVDTAFYVGTNNKAYFKSYGLTDNQLVFAPHAIENNRFSQNKSAEAFTLRKNLKIPEEAVLILFAGKLEKVKNIKLLLEVFNDIKHHNIHLLIVGNGPLEFLIKEGNDRLHFMSFQNQSVMPVIYHAADLFCLPSLSETWGLAVNEAMSCSKAVLVSDRVGCAVDLVKPGVNGEIFKSGDFKSLKNKIQQLSNKKLLRQYGFNSNSIIESWTIAEQAASFINVLESV